MKMTFFWDIPPVVSLKQTDVSEVLAASSIRANFITVNCSGFIRVTD
jgi:hypothetical protein